MAIALSDGPVAITRLTPAACAASCGSIGSRAAALMLVESRAVRTWFGSSRPGSRPSRTIRSSPLGRARRVGGQVGSRVVPGHGRSSSSWVSVRVHEHGQGDQRPAVGRRPSGSSVCPLDLDGDRRRGPWRGSPPRSSVSSSRPTTGSRGSSPPAGAGRRRRRRRAARRCRRASGGTGRTCSRAWSTRASRSSGCRPWSRSRPPTTSSRAQASRTAAPASPGLVQVLEDALQPGPVQVEDGLHDLPGVAPAPRGRRTAPPRGAGRRGAGAAPGTRARRVCPTSRSPGSPRRGPSSLHAEHRGVPHVEQLAVARGTCGRRTAGTGRSCGPPA